MAIDSSRAECKVAKAFKLGRMHSTMKQLVLEMIRCVQKFVLLQSSDITHSIMSWPTDLKSAYIRVRPGVAAYSKRKDKC